MRSASWSIPLVLVGIARQMEHGARTFTHTELQGWVPELDDAGSAALACMALQQRGLLSPSVAETARAWVLTDEGREACRSAMQASAGAQRPAIDVLARRLWRLLRMRTALTAEQAVSVLADAGDNTHSLQASISRHLRRWAKLRPDTVQIGARRVNGCLRYVLVKDIGATPPKAQATLQGVEREAKS